MITGLFITSFSAVMYAGGVILGELMRDQHDDERKRRIAIAIVGFCFFGIPLVPAMLNASLGIGGNFINVLPAAVSLIFAGITGPKAVGDMFPRRHKNLPPKKNGNT